MNGTLFGAVIKDPTTKTNCTAPDFEGNAVDQRSWTGWIADVLREARRLSIPSAPLYDFSDWRQLPSLTEAVQRAGWCWRGVAVWDKRKNRPQRGRFRQQAEFIAWASNGPMPSERGVDVLPGVLGYSVVGRAQRNHQTEKPLELMRQIVRITSPGGVIFDPFMGSGTTLIAAALEGFDSVGCEVSEIIFYAAENRLKTF